MITSQQLKANLSKILPRTFEGEVLSAPDQNADNAATYKVHLKARSRLAVPSRAWNLAFYSPEEAMSKPPVKLIHDFSTVELPQKLAIDRDHKDEIGWGRPLLTEYGIECDGVLSPDASNPNHPATLTVHNLKNGIPQQCSIDFSGGDYKASRIPEGMTGVVNGTKFSGPAVVISNWKLKNIAICKQGVDTNTEAELLSETVPTATISEITEYPNLEKLSAEPPVDATKLAEALSANTAKLTEALAAVEAMKAEQTQTEEKLTAATSQITDLQGQLTQAKEAHAKELELLNGQIEALKKPTAPKTGQTAQDAPLTVAAALERMNADYQSATPAFRLEKAAAAWPHLFKIGHSCH